MGERSPASAPRLPARPRRDFAPRRPPQAEKFLCGRTSSRSPLGLLAPRLAVLRCWLSRCARACEALGADPELRGARGGDRGVQPDQGVGARRGSGGRSWHEATELRADRRRRGARQWVLLGSERLRRRWDCCCAPGWDARALRGAEATGSQGSSRTMLPGVRAQPSATASGTC